MKRIIILNIIIFMSFGALTSVAQSKNMRWANICPDDNITYCDNVGKNAYSNSRKSPLPKGTKLGRIEGVAWRRKGAMISHDGRRSMIDAFYYIVNDGSGKTFLALCRDTKAK